MLHRVDIKCTSIECDEINIFYLATDPLVIIPFKVFLSAHWSVPLRAVLVFYWNLSGLLLLKSPSGVLCAKFDASMLSNSFPFTGHSNLGTARGGMVRRVNSAVIIPRVLLIPSRLPDTKWNVAEHGPIIEKPSTPPFSDASLQWTWC